MLLITTATRTIFKGLMGWCDRVSGYAGMVVMQDGEGLL